MSYDEQDEVRCKRCRERGLFWAPSMNGGGYVLVDEEGKLHDCPELSKPASAKEFPES